jgi:alanine racemase
MLDSLRDLLGLPEYHQLNTVEISKENLISNYKYLSKLQKKVKIAPVLKSNAYGHGIVEIAQILDNLNCPYFFVDSLYEAYELLKINIKTPILIMGYIDPLNLQVKELPFSYAIWDLNQINTLDKFQPGASVHIFVETGMYREGILLEDLPNFLKVLKMSNLKIEGLMSHLASGDKPNDPTTKLQIYNFKKAIKICKENKVKPKYIHLQSSEGILNLKVSECNLARVGMATYGCSYDTKLKPVLQFKTKLIQIKSIKKGEKVGYEGTFKPKKNMKIGILPAGYSDGLDRRLSNKGFVKIKGKFCKIIGRVSMNITTIDTTEVKDAKVGDEVIIFSNSPTDLNSIDNTAKICNTISYDLLVHLASSTKRKVI